MLAAFLCAAVDGDVASLELMLAEDVRLYAGGDRVVADAASIASLVADDPFDVRLTALDGRVQRVYVG
jgi:hypothetical protein